MAKDRTAKTLQKQFGLTYQQALNWVRTRREEIDKEFHKRIENDRTTQHMEVVIEFFHQDWEEVKKNEEEWQKSVVTGFLQYLDLGRKDE